MALPVIGTTAAAQAANQSLAATATAAGAIKFVGPSGLQGSTTTCVVTVPSAPPGAIFTATLGTPNGQGVVVGTWGGPSTAGRFQVGVGQTLVVTGTGLALSTAYTCTFGMVTDVGDVQVVVPEPNSSTLASAQLAQIAANTGLTNLGTGQDGAVTISTNTALARDMNYTSLTVAAGVTLTTNGFRIYATGTVTVLGTIDNSGGPGQGNGNSTGAPAGTLYGGTAGNGASAGTNQTNGSPQGGAGGATPDFAGGTTTPGPSLSLGGVQTQSPGGGASGGGTTFGHGNGNNSGGGGGGVIEIFCAVLSGNGTISANGGAGLNGIPANGYGTAGGGGGVIFIGTNINLFTGTITVVGGAGGVGAGTGVSGNPGTGGQQALVIG